MVMFEQYVIAPYGEPLPIVVNRYFLILHLILLIEAGNHVRYNNQCSPFLLLRDRTTGQRRQDVGAMPFGTAFVIIIVLMRAVVPTAQ